MDQGIRLNVYYSLLRESLVYFLYVIAFACGIFALNSFNTSVYDVTAFCSPYIASSMLENIAAIAGVFLACCMNGLVFFRERPVTTMLVEAGFVGVLVSTLLSLYRLSGELLPLIIK